MAENVQDVTLEVLKSIQASIADLSDRIDGLGTRFDRLETAMRKDRRNAAGMLVMMRATAGDFDQRVTEVEERLIALEAHRP